MHTFRPRLCDLLVSECQTGMELVVIPLPTPAEPCLSDVKERYERIRTNDTSDDKLRETVAHELEDSANGKDNHAP